jgi:hypothetical protein
MIWGAVITFAAAIPVAIFIKPLVRNGLLSRLSEIWAEDSCLTEEKASFLTPFLPRSMDLP